MAKHHKALAHIASAITAYGKSMLEDPENHEAHHRQLMEDGEKGMDMCAKAEVAATLEKVRDQHDRVRPITISAVATPAPSVRAVPRYGQRSTEKPNVDAVFQKLVAVDEDPDWLD